MSQKLSILADENIPALEQTFAQLGNIQRKPGRNLQPEDVRNIDVLLVRSITQVTPELLAEAENLKFVGTATIGTDHIDQAYLQQQGIGFSSAPGCNADSVVEYVLSAVYSLLEVQGRRLQDLTVGIVGVGNVGGRLQQRLAGLGVNLLLNDPPRAEREGAEGFSPLDKLLIEADVICLHTPLVREGKHPSRHLIGAAQLELLKPGAILLNAGRGPVIDNSALLAHCQAGADLQLVLDVWEQEPDFMAQLAPYAEIATPHIAGYSLDGKIRGTFMLYEALCRHLNLERTLAFADCVPQPALEEVSISGEVDIPALLRLVYDPFRDDRAFRRICHLPDGERGRAFDQLRKSYPVRRELAGICLRIPKNHPQYQELAALGFQMQGA